MEQNNHEDNYWLKWLPPFVVFVICLGRISRELASQKIVCIVELPECRNSCKRLQNDIGDAVSGMIPNGDQNGPKKKCEKGSPQLVRSVIKSNADLEPCQTLNKNIEGVLSF